MNGLAWGPGRGGGSGECPPSFWGGSFFWMPPRKGSLSSECPGSGRWVQVLSRRWSGHGWWDRFLMSTLPTTVQCWQSPLPSTWPGVLRHNKAVHGTTDAPALPYMTQTSGFPRQGAWGWRGWGRNGPQLNLSSGRLLWLWAQAQ